MAEYIVAIDVTRVRFPADAFFPETHIAAKCKSGTLLTCTVWHASMDTLGIEPRASRMLSGCDTTTPRALEDVRPDVQRMCLQLLLAVGVTAATVHLRQVKQECTH